MIEMERVSETLVLDSELTGRTDTPKSRVELRLFG
jgi:hypothetical protein